MNTSELLRKLADIIDRMQHEVGAGQQADPNPNQPAATLVPVEVVHVDTSDPTTMVSPLQQKFELGNQCADVEVSQPTVMMQPNVDAQPKEIGACSDSGTEAQPEEQTDESGEDEMDVMRRNAGLPATGALMIAREDH